MVGRVKLVVLLAASILVGYMGWNLYGYFFDTSNPVFVVTGIQENKIYAGDIVCTIKGKDEYKVQDISIAIDGVLLVNKFKINKTAFEYPFVIPTKTMPNGTHELAVELTDSAYKKNTTYHTIAFGVDNLPLQAAWVKIDNHNKVFQGRTLHLQFQVNKEIEKATIQALSSTYRCCAESPNSLIYECFVPIKCEEVPNEYIATIEIVDKVGTTFILDTKFQVVAYPFKRSTVNVQEEKVQQEQELGKSQREFAQFMADAVSNSPHTKLWHGVFYDPIEIKAITAEFGVIRTTQKKGRYVHQGIDVTNAPRSVVWAPQDGVIIVKDRFEDTGNTVVIDHGCGIFTLLCHLDSFASINVGELVKKGEPIGKIGMTGYANGFHLHWEMRINNIPVDPAEWTKNNF